MITRTTLHVAEPDIADESKVVCGTAYGKKVSKGGGGGGRKSPKTYLYTAQFLGGDVLV